MCRNSYWNRVSYRYSIALGSKGLESFVSITFDSARILRITEKLCSNLYIYYISIREQVSSTEFPSTKAVHGTFCRLVNIFLENNRGSNAWHVRRRDKGKPFYIFFFFFRDDRFLPTILLKLLLISFFLEPEMVRNFREIACEYVISITPIRMPIISENSPRSSRPVTRAPLRTSS